MASIKISELESVTSLTESDALPIVNGNETKKVTIEKLGDILATKDYVTETLGEIGSTGFTPIIVETLPTTNISTSTVYLVLNKQQADKNIYDEYIYVGEKWEIIGSTAVDLSNYYTKTEVDNMMSGGGGGSVDTSNIQEFPTIDLTDYLSYTETGNYIDITAAGKEKLSELFTNYYKRHNTIAGLNFTITSNKYNPRSFKMLMLYREELSAGNVYFYQIMFPADLDISSMSYTSMNFNYTVSEDGTVTLGQIGDWGSDFKNGLSKNRIKDYVLTKSNTTSFTPTGDYHPATKKYVDDAIAAIEIPEGGGETSSNPAIYFLDLGISGFQFVDYTWVSGTSETGVKLYELLNTIISDGNEENFILVVSNSIATHKRYILTLSPESDKLSTGGSIKFSGTQFWNDSKGVLKYYVCALTFTAKLTDGVLSSGGSITVWTTNSQLLPTDNITAYTPSSDYHPATKKYVDDTVANAGGGAETGFVLNGSPVFKIGCNYIHQLEVGKTYSGYINADDAIAMYKYCVENGVEYPAINLLMNSSNAEFTGIGISRTKVVDITGSSAMIDIYGLSSSNPNKYWYMDLRISCTADGTYTMSSSTSIRFSEYTGATKTYVDNAISTAITTVLEAEY